MTLTPQERNELHQLLLPYQNNAHVMKMKRFLQHGSVSTYRHAWNVTEYCYLLNRRFRLHANVHVLVRGAFLHDFYLYDWHVNDKSHRLHGIFHPNAACRNAVQYFHIGEKEQHIIRCHMWPLTLWALPRCREAWILCAADKYISLKETILMRKNS